jgi:Spy/CpxP family protein refolding chaperone
MLKMFFTAILLFSMTALPNVVICQDAPMGKWWHNPHMSKQLKLTDEEKNKLDEQYVESRRKMIDLKRNVERERFELETLIESDDLDEDSTKKQFKKLEKARTDLAGERFKFLMESRKILGNERFKAIKQMYKKNKRNNKRHKKEQR